MTLWTPRKWRVVMEAHTGLLDTPAGTWPITGAEPVAYARTRAGALRLLLAFRRNEQIRRRSIDGLRAWYSFRVRRV